MKHLNPSVLQHRLASRTPSQAAATEGPTEQDAAQPSGPAPPTDSAGQKPDATQAARENGSDNDVHGDADRGPDIDQPDAGYDGTGQRRLRKGALRESDLPRAPHSKRVQSSGGGQKRRGKASVARVGPAWCADPDAVQDADDTDSPAADDAIAGNECIGIRSEGGKKGASGHAKGESKGRRQKGNRRLDQSIGSILDDDEDLSELANQIAGRGDRAHYLAMAAATSTALLRGPTMETSNGPPVVRPRSRAECERRCGSDGFCDPSSIFGCGGEYCGQQYLVI